MSQKIDEVSDVIVVGAGAAGLAAAVAAANSGAQVLVIDENSDIGGHAMLSGGWVSLGGGHSLQQKIGIVDSADAIYEDWIKHPGARFNDRSLVRTFADQSAATFEFLLESGVNFLEELPVRTLAFEVGATTRRFHAAEWPNRDEVVIPDKRRNGSGIVRPLERKAKDLGVRFLLGHRFESLMSSGSDGNRFDLSSTKTDAGPSLLRARKGIILSTGGHTSNVEFRRIFDPRLTEIYQVAGEPYSRQSAASEIAALRIGASLWGTGAQTAGTNVSKSKTTFIGTRWGYPNLVIEPPSPIFHKAKATGLNVTDWSDIVLVGGAGRRFWDESDDSDGFIDAALATNDGTDESNGGDPTWAIFDAGLVERQGWQTSLPWVDPDGFFFQSETLEGLADAVSPAIGRRSLAPQTLRATIDRYNSFVPDGVDADFGKKGLKHPIVTPPFYAAWATPILHDSLTGLRTTANAEVVDLDGAVIPGIYAAGETQGGFSQHGLARALLFGRLAGIAAAGRS